MCPEFYIGTTSNISKRPSQHRSNLISSNTPMARYIRKYGGFDSWIFQILEEGIVPPGIKDYQYKRERIWITNLKPKLNSEAIYKLDRGLDCQCLLLGCRGLNECVCLPSEIQHLRQKPNNNKRRFSTDNKHSHILMSVLNPDTLSRMIFAALGGRVSIADIETIVRIVESIPAEATPEPPVSAPESIVLESSPTPKLIFKSPEWFTARGGGEDQKTLKSHLSAIDDVTQWKTWAQTATSAGGRRVRLQYIVAWHPFTIGLNETDAKEASSFLKEISDSIKKGETRLGTKTTGDYQGTFGDVERVRADIESGKMPVSALNLFGGLLLPRRNDPATLVIFDKISDDDGKSNVFVKETETLIFRDYKTVVVYGPQVFPLGKHADLRIHSRASLDKAITFLKSFKNGEKFYKNSYASFSTLSKRALGGNCINDFRHYFSSKFRVHPDPLVFRAVCDWLAHSPGTSVENYSV